MLTVKKVTNNWEQEAIFKLRYLTYCIEECYITPTPSQAILERESDELDDFSTHFIALEEDLIVGCFRVIHASKKDFPCEKEFSLNRRSPSRERTFEMSRFIVTKEARVNSRQIMMAMIRELYWYCKEENIDYCYAVMESNLISLLTRLGLPFDIIGEHKDYMNTLNFPTMLDIPKAEILAKSTRKFFHEYCLKDPRRLASIR